jgi:hypothetical protein
VLSVLSQLGKDQPTSHAICDLLFATAFRDSILASLPAHRFTRSHSNTTTPNMPPLRTSRNRKPPPDGFDDIEDTLLEFANKMKDAENASHEGKKKHEMLWPVFQITHQRTYALG